MTPFLLLSTVLAFAVNTVNHPQEKPLPKKQVKTLVAISDNLWCDQTEITNLEWREYVSWTARVYGENAPELLATLPDSTLWHKKGAFTAPLIDLYHNHEAYNHYPVVNISQQQAVAFSKWRADRYFEAYLINTKKLEKVDFPSHPNDVFCIEKCLSEGWVHNGQVIVIDTYPVFRLPSQEEFQMLCAFNDSTVSQCNEKKTCATCLQDHPITFAEGSNTAALQLNPQTTQHPCLKRNSSLLVYLKGNVAEWLNEIGHTGGGKWTDDPEAINSNLTETAAPLASPQIGFRNVLEWKPANESIF